MVMGGQTLHPKLQLIYPRVKMTCKHISNHNTQRCRYLGLRKSMKMRRKQIFNSLTRNCFLGVFSVARKTCKQHVGNDKARLK